MPKFLQLLPGEQHITSASTEISTQQFNNFSSLFIKNDQLTTKKAKTTVNFLATYYYSLNSHQFWIQKYLKIGMTFAAILKIRVAKSTTFFIYYAVTSIKCISCEKTSCSRRTGSSETIVLEISLYSRRNPFSTHFLFTPTSFKVSTLTSSINPLPELMSIIFHGNEKSSSSSHILFFEHWFFPAVVYFPAIFYVVFVRTIGPSLSVLVQF